MRSRAAMYAAMHYQNLAQGRGLAVLREIGGTRFTLGPEDLVRLLGPQTAAVLDRPWADIAAALASAIGATVGADFTALSDGAQLIIIKRTAGAFTAAFDSTAATVGQTTATAAVAVFRKSRLVTSCWFFLDRPPRGPEKPEPALPYRTNATTDGKKPQ